MRILIRIIFAIYLLIVSGRDIRTRCLPLGWMISGPVIVLLLRVGFERGDFLLNRDLWCGIVCGLFFIGISWLGQEKLGFADSIAIMGIFIMDGYDLGIMMVMISFLLAGIVALILLIRKRAGRETAIPFLPFLLAGYVGGILLTL